MFSISSTYSFLFSQTLSSLPFKLANKALGLNGNVLQYFSHPVSIVILLGNFTFLSQPLNSCVSGFPCYFHELPLRLIAGVLFSVFAFPHCWLWLWSFFHLLDLKLLEAGVEDWIFSLLNIVTYNFMTWRVTLGRPVTLNESHTMELSGLRCPRKVWAFKNLTLDKGPSLVFLSETEKQDFKCIGDGLDRVGGLYLEKWRWCFYFIFL